MMLFFKAPYFFSNNSFIFSFFIISTNLNTAPFSYLCSRITKQ